MAVMASGGPEVAVFVFTLLVVMKPMAHIRIWKTLYMDDEASCELFIRNDDLNEGDMYVIKSDSWQGQSPWARRPAECTININLGDRLVALNLVEWWCDKAFTDPFLAVYDTCVGGRTNLLAQYNCSNVTPRTIHSSSTCISLYHFRGHTRWGYFFSLELVGRNEVIAFPAGGIAALMVLCIVVVMVIVKVVCVATGYENRLPVINNDPEDPKQTLLALDLGTSQSEGALREMTISSSTGVDDVTGQLDASPAVPSPMGRAPMGRTPTGRPPTGRPPMCRTPTGRPPTGRPPTGRSSTAPPIPMRPQELLNKTHPADGPSVSVGLPHGGDPVTSGSAGAAGAAGAAAATDCWDSDAGADYSPPRLKSYVSVHASRLLRL